jgi:hypothetical protein
MDLNTEPEVLMASLNRTRQWKLIVAMASLALALGAVIFSSVAMYGQNMDGAGQLE